jgi:hypothetical protein
MCIGETAMIRFSHEANSWQIAVYTNTGTCIDWQDITVQDARYAIDYGYRISMN